MIMPDMTLKTARRIVGGARNVAPEYDGSSMMPPQAYSANEMHYGRAKRDKTHRAGDFKINAPVAGRISHYQLYNVEH